jgi:hypothetical protein
MSLPLQIIGGMSLPLPSTWIFTTVTSDNWISLPLWIFVAMIITFVMIEPILFLSTQPLYHRRNEPASSGDDRRLSSVVVQMLAKSSHPLIASANFEWYKEMSIATIDWACLFWSPLQRSPHS